ncbi:hypothetical protein PR202_gb24714 [Eleusine coracana subsp. coracana]|uniref:VOC domain-containing protein n=1 Tax=Eleusine coracana subsp. coracana TaxID=191504 RepID=A0AAV5FM29_ELECO|nr:hypothetical protein QOZ80_5BG0451520 [Eleusine coracana subsp. coracana]GJN35899.1 hypothetical protein PR202_gb24714 [Eleusine coracana subsp. coracana]
MVNSTAAAAAMNRGGVLPLASLNHISIVCRSVEESLKFYTEVLGFVPIRRPGSFNFDGAWLFNYGIGIHLLQSEDPDSLPEKREINPKDNHISFQCESMVAVERRLKELGIPYVQRCVEEGGINVDQIFFHDPDGFMIEICNCDNLPVIPLGDRAPVTMMGACKRVAIKQQQQQQQSAPVVTAAQCVPSSNAAIRVGEEAHISCA